MVERTVGSVDKLIGLVGSALKTRHCHFQQAARIRQIVHCLAGIHDESVDVLAAMLKYVSRVANVDKRRGDGTAVLVVKQRCQSISNDKQPGQELWRAIENFLQ